MSNFQKTWWLGFRKAALNSIVWKCGPRFKCSISEESLILWNIIFLHVLNFVGCSSFTHPWPCLKLSHSYALHPVLVFVAKGTLPLLSTTGCYTVASLLMGFLSSDSWFGWVSCYHQRFCKSFCYLSSPLIMRCGRNHANACWVRKIMMLTAKEARWSSTDFISIWHNLTLLDNHFFLSFWIIFSCCLIGEELKIQLTCFCGWSEVGRSTLLEREKLGLLQYSINSCSAQLSNYN